MVLSPDLAVDEEFGLAQALHLLEPAVELQVFAEVLGIANLVSTKVSNVPGSFSASSQARMCSSSL